MVEEGRGEYGIVGTTLRVPPFDSGVRNPFLTLRIRKERTPGGAQRCFKDQKQSEALSNMQRRAREPFALREGQEHREVRRLTGQVEQLDIASCFNRILP